MNADPHFAAAGSEKEKIDVRLSYRIVRLFSEGLYASPHKAVEELVANSFDAGARAVAIVLPADFHEQGATIAVVDDGEGMDADGLKQHWLIGKSLKRTIELAKLPRGRNQIGKFGIGKLATYVLARRLTHISKKGGKYYSTSMDFAAVDDRGDEEVEPKSPIRIGLATRQSHPHSGRRTRCGPGASAPVRPHRSRISHHPFRMASLDRERGHAPQKEVRQHQGH